VKVNRLFFSLLSIVTLLASACSATKYLAEDEKLYDRGRVTVQRDSIDAKQRKIFEEHLEGLLRPVPNKKLLGMRLKLGIYNMGGGRRRTGGVFKNWLKNRGEPPVLLSDVNREYNENLLRNRMENLGFFNARVTSDTVSNGKFAEITYNAFPGRSFRINRVDFEVDSLTDLGRDILATRPHSILRPGSRYNLDAVISERERIDHELKNKGYYFFSPDNLLVEVDSSANRHRVDMFLTLKPETPEKARQPYRIGNVFVFPNHRQTADGFRAVNPERLDSHWDNYYFIDRENTYRNKVLMNFFNFRRGELYNRHNHNGTIGLLVNLNAFRFVKNVFVENPNIPNTLDAYYYLTPMPRRSLRFEALAKTASVYNGTEANVGWTLRNAFRGLETLTFNVFGGYETQAGGQVGLGSGYLRYGAETTVTWPRLLSIYKWAPTRRFIPKTYAKVGYEFLDRRNAYTLNSLTLNYGYNWKENIRKQHDLALSDITYVQPRNISGAYRAQMDTVPALRHIVDPEFSFGPSYSFTFSNAMEPHRRHAFYSKSGISTSGNVLGLFQRSDGEARTLFGTAYAQFVKVETDLRHYFRISRNAQLASRIFLGMGYSHGNSRSLPYLKQYFSGGPNGLRAFRPRSVGPGSSAPENFGEGSFFADQTGDIKLELNTEYRAKISGMFHWAAFVDAGNVWLQRSDADKPGGRFGKDFIQELAVGAGAGLRFDFGFLIVRTDLATPLRVPHRPPGDRWTLRDIDLASGHWRRNNLMFNLGIGYPF